MNLLQIGVLEQTFSYNCFNNNNILFSLATQFNLTDFLCALYYRYQDVPDEWTEPEPEPYVDHVSKVFKND